jgi:hypothetical protein
MKLNNYKIKGKKGGMLLRDVIFSLFVFAAIISFAGIFVINIANEYSNTNMTAEYGLYGSAGSTLVSNSTNLADDLKDKVQSKDGLGFLLDVTKGIGSFLATVILTPFYVTQYLAAVLPALGIPLPIINIIYFVLTGALYGIIIFGILTAISRGSKV